MKKEHAYLAVVAMCFMVAYPLCMLTEETPVIGLYMFVAALWAAYKYFRHTYKYYKMMDTCQRPLPGSLQLKLLQKILPKFGDIVGDTDEKIELDYKGCKFSFAVHDNILTIIDPGWYRVRRNDPKLLPVRRVINEYSSDNKVTLTMDIAPVNDEYYYLNTVSSGYTFFPIPNYETYLKTILDNMVELREKAQQSLNKIDVIKKVARPMGFATDTTQPVNA